MQNANKKFITEKKEIILNSMIGLLVKMIGTEFNDLLTLKNIVSKYESDNPGAIANLMDVDKQTNDTIKHLAEQYKSETRQDSLIFSNDMMNIINTVSDELCSELFMTQDQ